MNHFYKITISNKQKLICSLIQLLFVKLVKLKNDDEKNLNNNFIFILIVAVNV